MMQYESGNNLMLTLSPAHKERKQKQVNFSQAVTDGNNENILGGIGKNKSKSNFIKVYEVNISGPEGKPEDKFNVVSESEYKDTEG